MKNNRTPKKWIWPKPSVAATAPISVGKAPGNAPTKTENGVLRFKGVYIKAYNNE